MVVVVFALYVFSEQQREEGVLRGVQKEKEDIFVMCFGNSNRRQKTIRVSRVRARRDIKNSVVVISKATEYYGI